MASHQLNEASARTDSPVSQSCLDDALASLRSIKLDALGASRGRLSVQEVEALRNGIFAAKAVEAMECAILWDNNTKFVRNCVQDVLVLCIGPSIHIQDFQTKVKKAWRLANLHSKPQFALLNQARYQVYRMLNDNATESKRKHQRKKDQRKRKQAVSESLLAL